MTDEMDEIWALYVDDGGQALDAVEEALDVLKAGTSDPAPQIAALFRAVHTFKGNSRVLGLAQVEGLAHLAEDLIGLVRDEGVPFDAGIGAVLLRTGDVLRGMLEDTADARADVPAGSAADLKDDLRAMIAKLTGTAAPDTAPAETKPVAKRSRKAGKPASDPVPDPDSDPDHDSEPSQAFDDETTDDFFDDAEEDGDFAAIADDADDSLAQRTAAADVPAAAPPPMINASLAGLLDQLDGGDGADFDAFDDDAAGDTVSDSADEADALADPVPVAVSAQPAAGNPVLAEVTDGRLLTIDPAYRKIFADMVTDTCAKLSDLAASWAAAESAKSANRLAGDLHYAASQMSLDQWCVPLDAFQKTPLIENADVRRLIDALEALYAQDLASEMPVAAKSGQADDSVAQGRIFFAGMGELYSVIADQRQRMDSDTPPSEQERRALGAQIIALAAPKGYVRLIDAAEHLTTVSMNQSYTAAELVFYEELVHIERAMPQAVFAGDIVPPSKLMGAWCRDHVYETLQNLRIGVENRKSAKGADWFPQFETSMRQVHFACLTYGIETASQLTMALIDLFARVRIDDKTPDVILLQMARGFIDTMELVFDALDQGDTPDTTRIEKMFEDATSVCFVASGMVTAKTIEMRLGLPPEFHRVLSPESVKVASDAMDAGKQFYVLRADLNEDDTLAQGFLECITSGLVQMITNVTVFLDQRTLFDFLVASSLPQDRMVEQLALLDPQGHRLSVLRVLESRAQQDDVQAPVDQDALDLVQLTRPADNTNLLEAVGAISASHALLEHDLTDLAAVDLLQEIQTALHQEGLPAFDLKVGAILRDQLDRYSQRLQQISESSTQLAAELTYLQQESVAQRSHPAEVLLRALGAFVAAQSVKRGTEAKLTHVGGQVPLDLQLIEELRQALKMIVTARLAAPHPPTRFHASIEAESDHIRVEISDNSPTDLAQADLNTLVQSVARKKGTLRKVVLPAAAGLRFHLVLPQKMIVLDGMVVRQGDVRYVLPIDAIQRILQTDQIITVSAGGQSQMLKLEEGGLLPIRPFGTGHKCDQIGKQLFVIVQTNGARFAVPVDELLGQQLVLLRPLQGVLASVRAMSGIAILSGGEIGLVVAVSALVPAEQQGAA